MHTKRKLTSMLLATLSLAACGSGISGTYAGGMGSIKFESGNAYATLMGSTTEMPYSTDGDKVLLQSPQANLVLTRNKDGSLITPWETMKPQ